MFKKISDVEQIMRKIVLIATSSFILTACGGGSDASDDQANQQNAPNMLYAFVDNGSGIGIGFKKYHLDGDKKLLVQNESTEGIAKNYATADGLSTTSPPQIDEKTYILGENASFDGEKLQYSVSNFDPKKPLILTKMYKQIDVSGRAIRDDANNPVRIMYSSTGGLILAGLLGIKDLTDADIFSKGSMCWQLLSSRSNQDYIQFNMSSDYSELFTQAEVEHTGTWNKVAWIRYKDLTDFPNTKLTIEGKDYWGLYYASHENKVPNTSELKCDLMNETAYKVVNKPFEKLNTPVS